MTVDSYYTGKDGKKKPLGSIGHLSAFSFLRLKTFSTEKVDCWQSMMIASINVLRLFGRKVPTV
jgi:dTDP-4-amino-4,6-dideoxygalactose transaminase